MDFLKKLIEAVLTLLRQAPSIETPVPVESRLTPEKLMDIYGCTYAKAAAFCDPLAEAMARYEIDSPLRQAHFLAQIGHESGRLRYTKEIWGPTAAQNRYEGRQDLGNTYPGDGKAFMGRGLIQLTGRSNYEQMRDALGVDVVSNPYLLEEPGLASLSAAWFWNSRKLNAIADRDDLLLITKRINGGTNGLEDRKLLLAQAKWVLGVT